MKESLQAISFAFKEILYWHTMRYALISGIIVTLIWTIIGFLFWPVIVSIASYILELIPFSMVRSNGASMLSVFLWMQVVLLTFALIYAFGGNIILRHISKERYGSLSVVILLISALFWGDYLVYKKQLHP